MAIRVIQWATGGVGRAAIAGVLAHPELELVGCWVHSAGQGRPRRRRARAAVGPIGVRATTDVEAWSALEADCVIYSPMMADPTLVARLLASGKNVVTPLNWFFAGGRDEALIEAACRPGRIDHPRHRHPSRRGHRALPARPVRPVAVDHPRAGRGVLRHPELRRARRGAATSCSSARHPRRPRPA